MPSCTSVGRDANGVCCRMICRTGKRFRLTFGCGVWMELGRASIMRCANKCVGRQAATRKPARRSWIVKVSRRPKKGAARLRCRQENKGPKTPYFGGYAGLGAGSARARGRYPRPSGCPVSAATAEDQTLALEKDLGRRQLPRCVGSVAAQPAPRTRASAPSTRDRGQNKRQPVRGVAQALDRRADIRLVGALAPLEQRLRSVVRNG